MILSPPAPGGRATLPLSEGGDKLSLAAKDWKMQRGSGSAYAGVAVCRSVNACKKMFVSMSNDEDEGDLWTMNNELQTDR